MIKPIKEILKLRENEYSILICSKCRFKVYMNELRIYKECGQCGSKKINVLK